MSSAADREGDASHEGEEQGERGEDHDDPADGLARDRTEEEDGDADQEERDEAHGSDPDANDAPSRLDPAVALQIPLKCPFPWWGGKRRVAHLVWPAFGADVSNYCEPFAGSLAMLLGRPGGPGKIETVNDLDRYLANFWRGIIHDPDAVARHADWPVNEADLHARHRWLIAQGPDLRARMLEDPEYFDAKIAGQWVWGLCLWIGSGWCVEPHNHKKPVLQGIGKGVHGKARNLTAQVRPHLSSAQGIQSNYASLPALGNSRGLHGVAAPPCAEWFRALQARLRGVRVACGDWKRILTPSVLGKGKNVRGRTPCAVFLDPPYDDEFRERDLYAEDASKLSGEVREWALEHGDDPDLRIALCGYLEEHDAHMPSSWRRIRWTGSRGYAAASKTRRAQETIWLSPHCLDRAVQGSLFDHHWN